MDAAGSRRGGSLGAPTQAPKPPVSRRGERESPPPAFISWPALVLGATIAKRNMQVDSGFEQALRDFGLRDMDSTDDVVYFVDHELRLRGFNDAWVRFAIANNGDRVLTGYALGTCVLDAILAPLRGYYQRTYQRVLGAVTPEDFDFECSSPNEFRLYRQTAYPLAGGIGLCITNHLAIVGAPEAPSPSPIESYRGEGGLIVQCQHCRKARRPGTPERWDWIPQLLESHASRVSHGHCPYCLTHYYPDIEDF